MCGPPAVKGNWPGLSGGNQQKVIIGREVTNDPDLLIAVQPPGAWTWVPSSMSTGRWVEQRDKGKAVLLISLELDEVIDLSDRIAIIIGGSIVDIIDAKGADENEIGLKMTGGGK